MERKSQSIVLSPEDFGAFWKYIGDDTITDIDYNGSELWVKNIYGEKKIVERDFPMPFLDRFCQRVADSVNGHFTPADPILEAETENLRISMIHETVATSGRSISIRHVSEGLRLKSAEDAIQSGYCSKEVMGLLINCVLAKLNISICGEMGIGKSECARFLSHYIPNDQRVITIEDSPEWHFKKINPGHDCVELKVGAGKTYSDLLKACLRQDATWIMLSEARSREVTDLIENLTSGARCITTLHTDDTRKIPARMISMTGSKEDAERMEYNIYDCLDVGILIRMKERQRYIDQVCFFYRENGKNRSTLLVANGDIVFHDEFPDAVMEKFKKEHIENPFYCKRMKEGILA
jgi:pilus assembly protein CpaF